MSATKGPITTHILDLTLGKPAAKVPVKIEASEGSSWREVGHGSTDADGRISDLLPVGSKAKPGTYRLTFETKGYFEAVGSKSFYPFVSIVFEVVDPSQHYHVPLLLSAYGYSTYRGS